MNLLVRADSSPAVGAGHVMRCLALAQACVDRGGTAAFATTDAGSPVFAALGGEESIAIEAITVDSGAGAGVEGDADEAAGAARRLGADWLVLDGYGFGFDYQRRVDELGLRLLVLDDFGHAERFLGELVLNQNLHATAGDYAERAAGAGLLLGPSYALLRREFGRWRQRRRRYPERAGRVLVTLGGGDAGSLLSEVLGSLLDLERPELEVRCLVGPLASAPAELRRLADEARCRITLETVGVGEMPEIMAWADVAVSGGGSTCWELAFMELPAIAVARNPHQESIAAGLEDAGAVLYAGSGELVRRRQLATLLIELLDNVELRRRLGARGRELVDGRGAERVMDELESRLGGGEV